MKTYIISLEGRGEQKGDLPGMAINSLADNATEACEAARTIVSTFAHHEYLSVHWRIEQCEDDTADLEISYKDKLGESHKEIFGHCVPQHRCGTGEMPTLRLVARR